jgi:hypothetical protein
MLLDRRECKDILSKAGKHDISALQLLSAAVDAAQPSSAAATPADDTPDMQKRMVGMSMHIPCVRASWWR